MHVMINPWCFIVILSVLSCISLPSLVSSDDVSLDTQSFSQRITTLQTETRYMCSHLKETTLAATKRLNALMQDVHGHCPDLRGMEVTVTNVAVMTEKYDSFVADQLSDCQELSKMLSKGLENGGLVAFYLKEGNYSLVNSILDKWHAEFTKFQATFYLTDTPLEIMLKNKKVFYYDHWFENIMRLISKIVLVTVSSVVFSSVLVWIGSILGFVALLFQFLTSLRRREPPQTIQPVKIETDNTPVGSELRQRRTTAPLSSPSNDSATPPLPLPSRRFYTMLTLALTVVLITVVWLFFPSGVSFTQSTSRLWYPEATAALDTLRLSRDSLQSNLSQQVQSIEELQRHANMYHDTTVQAHVEEFIRALGQSVQQVSKELSNAFISSEKMPSTLRRAYKSIESHAAKLGKSSEVKDLLVELDDSATKHEQFQRALQTAVSQQQKVLPTLKEQTQSMRALVRDDRLVEIGRLVNHHQDTLMEIDGILYRVDVELTNFIQVISDEHIDGMKKTIESLKADSATDQIKAIVSGIAGTTVSTVAGAVALKTGFAMVSVTASIVAAPALGAAAVVAGGTGMLGFGAYWAANKFDKYKQLSHFQSDLAAVETQRMNIQEAMKKVQEGISAQQAALKSTQSSLSKIADHCSHFSRIPGFTLNRIQRNAINEELMNAVTEYNRMMAVYSLFTENTKRNNHALPPAEL